MTASTPETDRPSCRPCVVWQLALPILFAAMGAAIWLSFPILTSKEEPYDDNEFWTCMLATAALGGLLSPRRAWLTGFSLVLPQLALLLVQLFRIGSAHAWTGLGVFLAFVALVTLVAELAATLRRLAWQWGAGAPRCRATSAGDP